MVDFNTLSTVEQEGLRRTGEVWEEELKGSRLLVILNRLGLAGGRKAKAQKKGFSQSQSAFEMEVMELLSWLLEHSIDEPNGAGVSQSGCEQAVRDIQEKPTVFLGIEALRQACYSTLLGTAKGSGIDLAALAAAMERQDLGELDNTGLTLLKEAMIVCEDPDLTFTVCEDIGGAVADSLNLVLLNPMHQARRDAKILAKHIPQATTREGEGAVAGSRQALRI